jgi:hypothetical protein
MKRTLVAFACVSGSAKSANVERAGLAESTLSRCSVFAHGFPEKARSGSYVLDRCADCVCLRSLCWAIITFSSRAPAGPSATRTNVPCCQPGLVVSSSTARCCWLAVVALLFLTLCCPTLGCFFSPALTYHQTHPSPDHPPYTTSPSSAHEYTTLRYTASTRHRPSPKSSRPARLGTAPANHPSKSHASDRRHQYGTTQTPPQQPRPYYIAGNLQEPLGGADIDTSGTACSTRANGTQFPSCLAYLSQQQPPQRILRPMEPTKPGPQHKHI